MAKNNPIHSNLGEIFTKLAWAIYFGIYGSFLILTSLSSFHSLQEIFSVNLLDLGIYLEALQNAIHKINPYFDIGIGTAFLYPPQSLVFFEPIRLIQNPVLQIYVVNIISLILIVLIIRGISYLYELKFSQTWFWYGLALLFAPLLENLVMRQTDVFIAAGIFGMYYWANSFQAIAGLCLSIAMMIKVTPIIFWGYLVALRQYKVLLWSIVFIGIVSVIALLRYGPEPFQKYPFVFSFLLTIFDPTANSQSLFAKLSITSTDEFQRFILIFPSFLHPFVRNLFVWTGSHISLIKNIMVFYFICILFISGLSTLINRKREPLFIICNLIMMFIPNILWYHHYIFFLIPLFLWMGWKRLDPSVTIWCLVGFLIIQMDRWYLTFGLLIHIFGHLTILRVLVNQLQDFFHDYSFQDLRKHYLVELFGKT